MSDIKRIKVGAGSCGIASGALELSDFLTKEFPNIDIIHVGCIGHCYLEPLIEVESKTGSLFYAHAKADKSLVTDILEGQNFMQLEDYHKRSAKEQILVTKLAGRINPVSIEEYMDHDGYQALKLVQDMDREAALEMLKESGLRGRGGGGFPTGLKWSFLKGKAEEHKVLICNADEGDPGAFMDRSLMEAVPHQILEGMLIGAYITGATTLFIYIRAEYPLAVKNLTIALKQLQKKNLHILNNTEITIYIKEGAGAFVCGEETAMIHSLEGKRGTPRFRPPYPTDSGYKGYPSAINNVETFGNIPLIFLKGSKAYSHYGTKGSKGTKLFALAGDLENAGLVEVPMGISIREIVYDIGAATPDSIKAVQMGGPSGGCIPEELLDVEIDYDSLKSLGAIMGSGGLIALGKNRCIVESSRYFLDFTARESCGKCTFCRVGTKRMLETLERITHGEGSLADIDFLEDIAEKIRLGSLCGLGQTAPNPVLSSIRYFRDEFIAHVTDKHCEALVCNALVDVYIDKNNCIECRLCIKNCPVNAISDDFIVNNDICTRCNSCIEVCPKNTIYRTAKGAQQ